MRHLRVIGLLLLAFVALRAYDLVGSGGPRRLPGASTAAVVARPIPQDRARIDRRSSERLEWNRATLQGAYDKIGKTSPRWDEPARQALDLAARMFSLQVDPVVTMADVHAPARRAVDAGCDDPLIRYLYARTSVGPADPGAEELTRRTRAAAEAMVAGAYPPFRRAVALKVLAESITSKEEPTPEERAEAIRRLDAALDLLPESAAKDPRNVIWDDMWYRELNSHIGLRRRLGVEDRAAFEAVDARLARVPGIEALRLAVRGNFFYYWGWEARTTAFAFAVGEGQFRTFESRVGEARAALLDSWKLNRDQPHVATLLLDIEKSIGDGDRDAMETWFDRAMAADGDDESACLTKLDWLDPKWHGGDSPEEMLAFGEACRATGNWRAGITLLDGDAHLRYYAMLPKEERLQYLRRPEVWSHIRSVYDEYLKHFPDDDVRRSKYAYLCFLGAHHAVAHAQFQRLGDRLTTWTIFPNVPLEGLKQMREFSASVVASKNHPRNPPAVRKTPGEPPK